MIPLLRARTQSLDYLRRVMGDFCTLLSWFSIIKGRVLISGIILYTSLCTWDHAQCSDKSRCPHLSSYGGWDCSSCTVHVQCTLSHNATVLAIDKFILKVFLDCYPWLLLSLEGVSLLAVLAPHELHVAVCLQEIIFYMNTWNVAVHFFLVAANYMYNVAIHWHNVPFTNTVM